MVDKRQFTFSKKERLCGKTRIEKIFYSGDAFLSYPFRVIVLSRESESDGEAPSLLISIPKKRLKKAVDRNRMKRLTREAYRLNKSILIESLTDDKTVDIALIYVGDKLQPYAVVEKGVVRALCGISKRLNNSNEPS